MVAVFAAASLRVEPHVNVAGEPRDTVYFDGAAPLASAPAGPGVSAETLRRRGAMTRVILMAGAAGRIRDITVRYTGERYQFGKPIGRFPGVQEHVVHVAQQAAMLEMAADLVCAAAAADPGLTGQAADVPGGRREVDRGRRGDDSHVGGPSGTRRDGHDPGVPAAQPHPPPVGLDPRVRHRHPVAGELGVLVADAGADALWPAIASGGATLTRA